MGSTSSEPAAVTNAEQAEALAAKKIKMSEVAKHSTATDCWTVIAGKVYDVDGYASRHPGGRRDINRMCGVDGTAKYRSRHDKKDPKNLAGKNDKYVAYKGVKVNG